MGGKRWDESVESDVMTVERWMTGALPGTKLKHLSLPLLAGGREPCSSRVIQVLLISLGELLHVSHISEREHILLAQTEV